MKRVRVTFLIEETREIEVPVNDDGFSHGDLIQAAREVEPFIERFVDVLDYEAIDG